MVRNYQKVKTLDEALRRLQTQRAARPRAPLPSHPAPTARHPALVSRKPQRDSGGSRVPQQRPAGVPACKSENPSGTRNQEVIDSSLSLAVDPNSPLEHALLRFGDAIKGKLLMNAGGGPVPAS